MSEYTFSSFFKPLFCSLRKENNLDERYENLIISGYGSVEEAETDCILYEMENWVLLEIEEDVDGFTAHHRRPYRVPAILADYERQKTETELRWSDSVEEFTASINSKDEWPEVLYER